MWGHVVYYTISVYSPNISRVQPAVLINGFPRLAFLVEVAHEDVTATETDFTVSLIVRIVYLDLCSRHDFAGGTSLVAAWRGEGGERIGG